MLIRAPHSLSLSHSCSRNPTESQETRTFLTSHLRNRIIFVHSSLDRKRGRKRERERERERNTVRVTWAANTPAWIFTPSGNLRLLRFLRVFARLATKRFVTFLLGSSEFGRDANKQGIWNNPDCSCTINFSFLVNLTSW